MQFPHSHRLIPLLFGNDLAWHPPSDRVRFWTAEDTQGVRWLTKLRGGFYAVRERAFSIIAQALEISCQSSTFLKMPSRSRSATFPCRGVDFDDTYQLASWFLDEHSQYHECCDDCPLVELDDEFQLRPYDVGVLTESRIKNALDLARGEMLGMLCEMHERPDSLFTVNHAFVLIDNDQMFSRNAGADLLDSPWIVDDDDRIRPTGLEVAARLCEQVLSLPDAVFKEAIRMPPGYSPRMNWTVHIEINGIRQKSRNFLKWANTQSDWG